MHENIKKGFLQACINHGSLEIAQVEQILQPMCEMYDEPLPKNDRLKLFISELNEELHEFNQALVFVKHSVVKKDYLVFVTTLESDVSKRQSHLTESDRFFFTKLIENIVKQQDYCINQEDARFLLNETSVSSSQRQSIQKNHILDIIELWTRQGYFLKHEHNLYFGPRMIVEFAGYLKINFSNYVQSCILCNKLVFWDVKCNHCNAKVHRDCIRYYLIKNSNCPACKKKWSTRLSENANSADN